MNKPRNPEASIARLQHAGCYPEMAFPPPFYSGRTGWLVIATPGEEEIKGTGVNAAEARDNAVDKATGGGPAPGP